MKTKCHSKSLIIVTVIFLSLTVTNAQDNSLVFGSDVHYDTTSFRTMLTNFFQATGQSFFGLVGDVGAPNGGGDSTSWGQYGYIYGTMLSSYIYNGNTISVTRKISQGNHDKTIIVYPGGFRTIYYPYTPTTSSEAYSNDWSAVYVLHIKDFTTSGAQALGAWLQTRKATNDGKVNFIMSHYPLHSTRGGIDQAAAFDIFDTLQNHGSLAQGKDSLDIVFLWGHNHSKSVYDLNIRQIAYKGQTIASGANDSINSKATTTLNFTCCRPGYVKAASQVTCFTHTNANYIGWVLYQAGSSAGSGSITRQDPNRE